MVSRLLRRLLYLIRQRQMDADLADELAFHKAMKQSELERSGMPADDAAFASRRALGNATLSREDARAVWMWRWLDDLWRDVTHAVRGLRRNPGFTAVAVLTLALGIGANTAIFSVVNAVLLRPLPYPNSDRLVEILENVPGDGSASGAPERVPAIDVGTLADFRSHTRTLSHIGVYDATTMTLTGRDEPVRLAGIRLSPAFFPMLGVEPLLGRTFEAREEASGADAVVILNHSAWQRYFNGNPNVLGENLVLDARSYSVVGIMRPGFQFPDPQSQFWIPFVLPAPGFDRRPLTALLKDGVSMQAAVAEISAVLQQLRGDPQTDPRTRSSGPRRFELVRVQDRLIAPVKPALLVLTATVEFVLLIACVNVANLLLARGAARQREIALRRALGAARGRLLRQALTESVMLALAGGVAGTGLALGATKLLRTFGVSMPRPDLSPGVSIPRLGEIGIDVSVLAFTVVVSILTGIAFGLGPAVRQWRPHPMDLLHDGPGAAISGFNLFRRHRTHGLLVVAEVAMATMLALGGGLLIHSFVKLSRVDPGYDPSNLLTFQAAWPRGRDVAAFNEDLVARLQALSGVSAAGYAGGLPMVQGRGYFPLRTTPERRPPPVGSRESRESPDPRYVSPDYLPAMGIRVIAGRGFGGNDRAGQPQVMLINQTLARSGLVGQNPVGHQVYALGRQPWEIIGILEDVRQFGLDREPHPQFFINLRQVPGFPFDESGPYFAVRTAGEPTSLAASIRGIVRQLDRDAIVDNIATMDQVVSNSISGPRLYAVLLGIFAGVAVALAAIGIYGVMVYSVTQRTREIGIRMALGAARSQVMGLVLGQSAALIGLGIVLGVAGAAAVTRFLEGMLFGLTPLDPSTFVAVVVLLALVATLAAFIPARRATKVDPMVALRCE